MISLSNPQGEMLLSCYRGSLPMLQAMADRLLCRLRSELRQQSIELSALTARVKTEESLAGKLERKAYKYTSLNDITDLVGLRVVTYYTDDVDKVAAIIKKLFEIDWDNSVDKRKLHELNSFGYNSLHYVCREQPDGMPFEIQMRTALQHVWSEIEHDIGYKGSVKLPREYRRQFSRLAGMLELADDEFSRLRTTMTEYRRQVHTLVKSGKLDEVQLSTDSFRSYLELKPFQRLNKRIAAANQAEIFPAPMMPFLQVLESFGLDTLGDVQRFIDEDSDDAYQLALSQLAVTDLDILSETVGLQNLCLVHALKSGGGMNGVLAVFDVINGPQQANRILAEMICQQASGLSFMKSARQD